ncbi:MAG: response regulator transcription factor [Chloroflexi bacterium]|nr:response regulator transcription factor [Chloroflexota bacterium]
MATVLIVEDDPTILETVAYNLVREGYDVLTAGDGVTGLDLARGGAPDLVVLDLMLPRMSGADVCRILRAERAVPIVMLTALDHEADKIEGLGLGADDYITKPFSMPELMARVAAALRRDRLSRGAADSAVGEVLEGAHLVLDTTTHEVTRDGERVALRPREFDLLEYLMRHQRQALTRDRILDQVWGDAYDGGTRTVDVHMRWLREKLEEDPAHPAHLLTVRGVGYKFVP